MPYPMPVNRYRATDLRHAFGYHDEARCPVRSSIGETRYV